MARDACHGQRMFSSVGQKLLGISRHTVPHGVIDAGARHQRKQRHLKIARHRTAPHRAIHSEKTVMATAARKAATMLPTHCRAIR